MDELGVRSWFDQYLNALAARGRGESEDLQGILGYYEVPLLVATDDAVFTLSSEDEVVGFGGKMVDGMRAAGFHHITTIESDVTVLNALIALYKGEFARERADGSEIGRLVVTYLIAEGHAGLRIAAMAVHSS